MSAENKVSVQLTGDQEVQYGTMVEGYFDYGQMVLGTPEDPRPVFKVVVKSDVTGQASCPFCGSHDGCDQFYSRDGVPGFPGIEDYVTFGTYIDPKVLGMVS